MKHVMIKVEGMKCGGCENRIEKSLSNMEGIKEVKANHEKGTVEVILSEKLNVNALKERIEMLGFSVIGEEI